MTIDPHHNAPPRKRYAKVVKRVILGLLILIGLALGSLTALISSETGTRVLAEQVRDLLGEDVKWRNLNGRITGPLEIVGLQVSLPGIEMEIDHLEVDWQPGALMQGEVRITRLEATSGNLTLTPAKEPTTADSTDPFDPAALQPPWDIDVDSAQIRSLSIYEGDVLLQDIQALDLSVGVSGDQVTVRQFDLRVAQGGIALTAETAMRSQMPLQLEATWDWRLASTTASDPTREIPLRGDLRLDGSVDWGAAIGMDFDYQTVVDGVNALSPDLPQTMALGGHFKGDHEGDRLRLEQVTLALDGSPLMVELAGTINDLSVNPAAENLAIAWQNLQWPMLAAEPLMRSASGRVDFSGTGNAYELGFDGDVVAHGAPPGRWQVRGSGDLTRFHVDSMTGSVLGGELFVSGPVSWDPLPRWELHVRGNRVNPETVLEGVPGNLSFAMDASGQLDSETGLAAEVVIQEFHGTLMALPIQGSVNVGLEGETVSLRGLALESENNSITAHGSIAPEELAIDWQLDLANPGAHLAGAQGRLTAQGRLSGTQLAPLLSATFKSEALTLETLTVTSIEGSAKGGLEPTEPLEFAITLGAVRDGEEVLLEAIGFQLQGVAGQHDLGLSANTAAGHVAVKLDGSLDDALETWSGKLIDLSVSNEEYGQWQLRAPAELNLSAEAIDLGESCLARIDGSGYVCVQARRTGDGDVGFAANLDELPIGMFVPTVTGTLAGDARGSLTTNGQLETQARVTVSPGVVEVPTAEGEESLPHGGGELRLTVDSEGLLANVEFAAPEEGRLTAEFRLPGLTTVPPAETQPLTGQATATLPRLDILDGWVPELESLRGRLQADVRVAGTLGQPQVVGELALAETQADIPLAGLSLREIEVRATSNPDEPGRLTILGGMRSGDGKLDMVGEADLVAGSFTLGLEGDRIQAYNTPDARAVLSPDLELSWSGDTLRVRGDLVIPAAAITPQINLRAAASTEAVVETSGEVLAPSPDVVVINRDEDLVTDVNADAAPFKIDSVVRVILGDDVNVDALGFRSRLAGTVVFINAANQESIIPIAGGRIDVVDGTFKAYGQDLDIETGQLIFTGKPATEPDLNVRAVRWIENDPEVTAAGIFISGPASEPALELFSRPQLEEPSEILSYLINGSSSTDDSRVLSIGTYVTPRIYVGYGYNLLESTSEFKSLFNITPRYGFSANAGESDSNINVTITYEN